MTPSPILRQLPRAAVVGIAILLAGCGIVRVGEKPSASPSVARTLLESQYERVQRFDGVFFLNVESPRYNLGAKGTCSLEHPDKFRGRLFGPFGIRLGDIILNGDDYWASVMNGQVREGKISETDISGITGLELPSDDLLSLFDPAAKPPVKGAHTLSFKVEKESGFWLWRVDEGTLVREIQLDPAKKAARSERWSTKDGVQVLSKQYDQYEVDSGSWIAHRLVLESRAVEPVKAELVYESLRFDPEWKDDPFKLMESTSR